MCNIRTVLADALHCQWYVFPRVSLYYHGGSRSRPQVFLETGTAIAPSSSADAEPPPTVPEDIRQHRNVSATAYFGDFPGHLARIHGDRGE
jgi:hypothetical protein